MNKKILVIGSIFFITTVFAPHPSPLGVNPARSKQDGNFFPSLTGRPPRVPSRKRTVAGKGDGSSTEPSASSTDISSEEGSLGKKTSRSPDPLPARRPGEGIRRVSAGPRRLGRRIRELRTARGAVAPVGLSPDVAVQKIQTGYRNYRAKKAAQVATRDHVALRKIAVAQKKKAMGLDRELDFKARDLYDSAQNNQRLKEENERLAAVVTEFGAGKIKDPRKSALNFYMYKQERQRRLDQESFLIESAAVEALGAHRKIAALEAENKRLREGGGGAGASARHPKRPHAPKVEDNRTVLDRSLPLADLGASLKASKPFTPASAKSSSRSEDEEYPDDWHPE